jgi:hypothetical protein
MSLLSKFNMAPKGDSYRIIENPIKYVGFILSEVLRKGRTGNNAASKAKSNPSSIASTDNSKGTLPK